MVPVVEFRDGGEREKRSPPSIAAPRHEIPPDMIPRHDEQENHAHQAGKGRIPGV
jgi:hypothetical protein